MSDVMASGHRERMAGNLEGAARRYRAAIEAEPVLARHHLGVVLNGLGQEAEAEAMLREAGQLAPVFAPAFHSLALLLLSQGRYAEGWRRYEARRALAGYMPTLNMEIPEWRGEPLAGKRVRVVGEQGLGDQIMFARFLPALEAMGATVAYVCSPSVAPLFSGAVAATRGAVLPEADFWAFVGSLPFRLGVELANLPPPATLQIAAEAGGQGVGVMVAGNPTHNHDALRSLHGEAAAELAALGRDLAPAATGARDFLETARIVAGLGGVATVDTSTAHLAATMGKPTAVLLQARFADWRWGRSGDRSAWYPSARLYRQTEPGDWRGPLAAVKRDLGQMAQKIAVEAR